MRAGGLGDGPGVVGRAAVHQYRLLHDAVDDRRDKRRERMRERPLGVSGRDDDRDHGAEAIGARG